MNAVAGLLEEINKLDKNSWENFEPALQIMARMEAVVQELINIALDLQDQILKLIVFRVEYMLPSEKETADTIAKSHEAGSKDSNSTINIGAVNIYSLEGVLSNSLGNFVSQVAGITEIYAPEAYSGEQPMVMPELDELQTEKLLQTGMSEELRSNQINERKEGHFEDAVTMRNDTLYNELKRSALIINELKTIRDSRADILNGGKSMDVTRIQLSQFGGAPEDSFFLERSSAEYSLQELVYDNIKEVSETAERISRSFHPEIKENTPTFDSAVSIDTSAPSMPGVSDFINISGEYIKFISETADRISNAFFPNILEATQTVDSSVSKDVSTLQISGLTTPKELDVAYSDQRMIEVPAFIPVQKITKPSDEAANNVEKLSNAIAKEASSSKNSFISRTNSSQMMTALPSVILPPGSVSSAFETMSEYITIASNINNQMNDIMEQKGHETNSIISQGSASDLLLRNEVAVRAFSLDRIASGESGDEKTAQVINLAQSFAAAGALQKAGTSAIKDIIMAAPSSGTGYQMNPAAAIPRLREINMQNASIPQRDIINAAQSGTTSSNFHNTFNIVVNVKGGKEESELRDLGRKIGLVLSDEIKRYGGIR